MARSSGRHIGAKVVPAAKYRLGEPEEIANRDSTGYQPEPTGFQQIRPADTSQNLNEPGRRVRSGDFKYETPT